MTFGKVLVRNYELCMRTQLQKNNKQVKIRKRANIFNIDTDIMIRTKIIKMSLLSYNLWENNDYVNDDEQY